MRLVILSLFAGVVAAQTISFRAPRDFAGGTQPEVVSTGDFNNDGNLDVITSDDAGYQFLAGIGDGSFRTPIASANGYFDHTVAGDFNGDGNLDLASINSYDEVGTVSVSLGNGDGTFRPPIVYPLPNVATSIAVGDFNGDGIPDLAFSIMNPDVLFDGSLSVLIGQADGTFAGAITTTANGSIYGIAAADLNGDGKLDLAAIYLNHTNAYMQVFLGDGLGSFAFGSNAILDANPVPAFLAISDLNGDGAPDVAVAGSTAAYVFLSSGSGTFLRAETYPVLDGESIAIADVNGDHKPDLLVGDYLSNGVSVLLGKGDGTFSSQLFAAAGYGVTGVASGDFNGDRFLDFVTVNQVSDSVSVFLGNPRSYFNATTVPVTDPDAIITKDFNDDGKLDFAVSTVSLGVTNTPLIVYLGDGKGGFTQSAAVEIPSAGSLVAGDFNGDGRNDIVAVSSDSISVLLGDGAGQFGSPNQMFVTRGLSAGITRDFDRDGILDLALSVTYKDQVAILLGNGDGTFQTPTLISVCGQPHGIASADLNGDKRTDLVVACRMALT